MSPASHPSYTAKESRAPSEGIVQSVSDPGTVASVTTSTQEKFSEAVDGNQKPTRTRKLSPKRKIKATRLAPVEESEEIETERRAAAIYCADACILGANYNKDEPWKNSGEIENPFENEHLARALSGIFTSALRLLKRRGRYAYQMMEIPKGHGKVRKIEAPDGPGAYVHVDEDADLKKALIAFETIQNSRPSVFAEISEDSKIINNIINEGWVTTGQGTPNDKLFGILRQTFSSFSGNATGATAAFPEAFDHKKDRINVLRAAQQLILAGLSNTHFSDAVCGFRPDSGTYEGLRRSLDPLHLKWSNTIRSVYQLDIRNFFPSVTREMAIDGLKKSLTASPGTHILSPWMIQSVAESMTAIACIDERLAQGSHVSPMLANIYAQYAIDKPIQELLKKYCQSRQTWERYGHGVTSSFARYADDIVIFSNHSLPPDLREQIDSIVERAGMTIAAEKRLYQEGAKRYEIWGANIPPEAETATPAGMEKIPRYKWAANFRFMLPKNIERRYCAFTFETIDVLHAKYRNWKDLSCDLEFQKMVGYFSHAYHISYFWHIRTVSKKTGRTYALSQELTYAWEAILSKFWTMLPDGFRERLFVVKD